MSAKHTWPIRVYWEDTDAGGIVFYANYLKFFERGRTEWLRSLELHQQTLKTTVGGMFVVSETQVRYHQPCRLDDVVIVETELLQVGRVAIDLRQTVWLHQRIRFGCAPVIFESAGWMLSPLNQRECHPP